LSDLEKVTKQAYAMVSYFGMSEKVGHISFYDSHDSGYNFGKPYSEKTAELIDAEAKALIDNAHKTALEVLNANMDGFTELAELLLSREVIFSEDMERIFGPRANTKQLESGTDEKSDNTDN
jgi:cell division protease FtsH